MTADSRNIWIKVNHEHEDSIIMIISQHLTKATTEEQQGLLEVIQDARTLYGCLTMLGAV
jgi:hypothetical protein